MKTFTDSLGRTWSVVVNVATIKRVRNLCNVDLASIVEFEQDSKPSMNLFEKLSSDPVLLVDVLYAVCKPECEQKNVSDEDFGASMDGDSIEQATDALLEGIIDFFPEVKRLFLHRILSAAKRLKNASEEKMKLLLADDSLENKVVSALEQSNGSSVNLPASAE